MVYMRSAYIGEFFFLLSLELANTSEREDPRHNKVPRH